VVICVVGYTLLTGGHPSAVRSGIMVGLASVALLVGRVPDAFTSLLVATVAMALVDPPVLLDVSLQLSVSATLGLILLWPRFRRRLHGVPRALAEPAGVTLAVTIATLPIELAVFQSVSLVSPLSHIAAVPLLPLVFASAALLALVPGVAHVLVPLDVALALPSTLLVITVRFFGTLPAAAIATGRLSTEAAVTLATLLLAWGVWWLPELRALRARVTHERGPSPGNPPCHRPSGTESETDYRAT
jgi:competence protein ComEC